MHGPSMTLQEEAEQSQLVYSLRCKNLGIATESEQMCNVIFAIKTCNIEQMPTQCLVRQTNNGPNGFAFSQMLHKQLAVEQHFMRCQCQMLHTKHHLFIGS